MVRAIKHFLYIFIDTQKKLNLYLQEDFLLESSVVVLVFVFVCVFVFVISR